MTEPLDAPTLTPQRQRNVLLILLAFVITVAVLITGASPLFSNPKPYSEMTFTNQDEANKVLPDSLISSTKWGGERGWIVWTPHAHKDASKETIRSKWADDKCFWVASNSNKVQTFDPKNDKGECDPMKIPNVKIPENVAIEAANRVDTIKSNLQRDLSGVPGNRVTFALTSFIINNWADVAAPTDVVQPSEGTIIMYLPVRDVPYKELTASGTGMQPVVDACLTVTSARDGNTIGTAESCGNK